MVPLNIPHTLLSPIKFYMLSYLSLLNMLIYHMHKAVVTWQVFMVSVQSLFLKISILAACIDTEDSHDDQEAKIT